MRAMLETCLRDVIASPSQVDVDEGLLGRVVQMGFRDDYARSCVKRNMHNVCSTTYWLLVHKKASVAASRGEEKDVHPTTLLHGVNTLVCDLHPTEIPENVNTQQGRLVLLSPQ